MEGLIDVPPSILWAGILFIVILVLGKPTIKAVAGLKGYKVGKGSATEAWINLFWLTGLIIVPIAAVLHPFLGLLGFGLIFIAMPYIFTPSAKVIEVKPEEKPKEIQKPAKKEKKKEEKKEKPKKEKKEKKGLLSALFGKRKEGKGGAVKIEPIIAPSAPSAPAPPPPKKQEQAKPEISTEDKIFYEVLGKLEKVAAKREEKVKKKEEKREKKEEDLLALLGSEEKEEEKGEEEEESGEDELEELEKLLSG